MVRSSISRCSLALLLLQLAVTTTTTDAFSPVASRKSGGSPLFGFSAFHYEEPDAIMMEQNGGIVPSRPVKHLKTKASAMSRIRIEKPSDDQHDLNHHDVSTVASAMSRVERTTTAATVDDQHDANHHDVSTVASAMSRVERTTTAATVDDQHDANHHDVSTVASAMSRVERTTTAATVDDQHDANYRRVRTVPSAMSETGSSSSKSNDESFKTIAALPAPAPKKAAPRTATAVPRSRTTNQGAKAYYE